MRSIIVTFMTALAAAGCYSSAHMTGDASDAAHDPVLEGDAGADPVADPPVDIPEEEVTGCAPSENITISFTVDGESFPMLEENYAHRCTIDGGYGTGTYSELQMACTDESGNSVRHILGIETSFNQRFYMWDTDVIFQYVVEIPWWIDRWFVLRDAGGNLIMAGLDSSSLLPWRHETGNLYAPLDVEVADTDCPAVPTECYDGKRLALHAAYGSEGETMVISGMQGGFALDDPLAAPYFGVDVASAIEAQSMQCTDTPGHWFTALVFQVPGD
jgi:hypothetical protein